jgi:hypothetical protein
MMNLFKRREKQMTFKRLLMPMLVLGIVLVMGTMAHAQTQINCGLSITPVAAGGGGASTKNATATGHTEPIAAGVPTSTGPLVPASAGGGGVRVTCFNNGAAGSATDPGVVALTISLGVPITNTTSTATAAPANGHPSGTARIRVGTTFGGHFNPANVCINLVNNAAGVIVVGLGTPTAPATCNLNGTGSPTTGISFAAGPTTSFFDLQGVLVSTNGKTGALVASMTSTGGITVGPTATPGGAAVGAASIQVVDNILAGLKDPAVPSSLPSNTGFFAGVTGGPAVLSSAGNPVGGKNNFVLRIEENYADMLRDATQINGSGAGLQGVFPPSGSSDTQLQIVLSNIPSGLDISNCSATITNVAGTGVNPGTTGTAQANFTNITAASPVVTINFQGSLDLDLIDVVWVKCLSVGLGSATPPLPSTPVTVQVTLAPTGSALSGGGTALTALTTGNVPRYQQLLLPSTPVPIVLFPPANTNLLVSFASVSPGYNTGIAIANTSTDPFSGSGGATASSGTITFFMVNTASGGTVTTKSYTTAADSPGFGLSSNGSLPSGGTYVVNLSEILAKASFGTTFTGYVFVTANFTFAHGAATIYTTSNGAAALNAPVLVLPAISTAATRATPDVGAGLGQ